MKKFNSLLIALFLLCQAAASAQASPKDTSRYRQVQTPEGWEFWDKDGLAFKLDKNEVPTYSRDLRRIQRQMNASRPTKAPFIPETGRYNYEMLQYGHVRLEDQWSELDRSRHSFPESLTKQLDVYLASSREAISNYKSAIDRFQGADSISEREIPGLQASESEALRAVTMGFLETEKISMLTLEETLEPKALAKAIDGAPLTPHSKLALTAGEGMRRRVGALLRSLELLQGRLAGASLGELDSLEVSLNQTQQVFSVLARDSRRLFEAPGFRIAPSAK